MALAASALPAFAQPLPLPKTGQCPSGFTESGAYCVRCGGGGSVTNGKAELTLLKEPSADDLVAAV